jgi:copper(I)-binding protein
MPTPRGPNASMLMTNHRFPDAGAPAVRAAGRRAARRLPATHAAACGRPRSAAGRPPARGPAAALAAAAFALAAPAASAHVVLPPGGAAAGSTYAAAFKVGHACEGARSTTALTVHLPDGFTLVKAQPRAGWTLTSTRRAVTWTAASPQAALPGTRADSFTLVGRLTRRPGTLWFPTRQTCDVGAADWSAVPAAGGAAPAFPAPHLDVLAPGVAAIDVRDAWARPTVPGQTSSVVYARITAPSGGRLVGASSPVGEVSIHDMRMEGDIMRMRDLDAIELPAGQAVALAPNGLHLMLTGLRQPLAAGAQVPLTLRVVDREGRRGTLAVQVPVAASAPAGDGEHHHG